MFRRVEKAKEIQLKAQSKALHEEGKRNDWWLQGDLEEIKGKPCESCGKILCYCEHFRHKQNVNVCCVL